MLALWSAWALAFVPFLGTFLCQVSRSTSLSNQEPCNYRHKKAWQYFWTPVCNITHMIWQNYSTVLSCSIIVAQQASNNEWSWTRKSHWERRSWCRKSKWRAGEWKYHGRAGILGAKVCVLMISLFNFQIRFVLILGRISLYIKTNGLC